MRKAIFLVVIFAANALYAANTEEDKLTTLEKENESLRRSLESQQKIIAYLTKKLDAAKVKFDLTEAVKEAQSEKSEPAKPAKSPQTQKIIYRGKERTPEWLDKMYERFCNNYWHIEGRILSTERVMAEYETLIKNKYVDPGRLIFLPTGYQVQSTISASEILVNHSRLDLTLHVHSLGRPFVDKEMFGPILAECTGQYRYNAVGGGTRTVLSVKPCDSSKFSRLTKSQFRNAVTNGWIVLYDERLGPDGKIIKKPIP